MGTAAGPSPADGQEAAPCFVHSFREGPCSAPGALSKPQAGPTAPSRARGSGATALGGGGLPGLYGCPIPC